MLLTPNLVIGLTIMAVGLTLLLDTLGIAEAGTLLKFWPALVVLFGASIAVESFRRPEPGAPNRTAGVPCFFLFLLAVAMFGTFGLSSDAESRASGERIHVAGVMGRAENTTVGDNVRSARVAAVMGRSSLDLRQVSLPPGEEVVVDVYVAMGRVTVRIPDHWVVDAGALPIMGSVEQERFTPFDPADVPPAEKPEAEKPEVEKSDVEQREAEKSEGDRRLESEPKAVPPPTTGPPPRLKLRGVVMMGKVEVTS